MFINKTELNISDDDVEACFIYRDTKCCTSSMKIVKVEKRKPKIWMLLDPLTPAKVNTQPDQLSW